MPRRATRAAPRKRKRALRKKISKKESYGRYLRKFMSYRDGVAYPPNHEFHPAALAAITPEEIVRWMKYRVYQDPDALLMMALQTRRKIMLPHRVWWQS